MPDNLGGERTSNFGATVREKVAAAATAAAGGKPPVAKPTAPAPTPITGADDGDETHDEPITQRDPGDEDDSPAPADPVRAPTPTEAASGVAEDEGSEGAEGGEEGGEAGAEPAAELFSIEIPGTNPSGAAGEPGTGTLQLDGLPQEFRDTIQFHVKRSARVPTLEQTVKDAREYATIADFYLERPIEAMHLVAKEKPAEATRFVRDWARQFPDEVLKIITELKLHESSPRELELDAKLALGERDASIDAGYGALQGSQRRRAYADEMSALFGTLTAPLKLSADDQTDLETLAHQRLDRVHRERKAQGREPFLTPQEATALLQPLIQKHLKQPTPTPKPKGQPTTVADAEANAKRAVLQRKALGGAPAQRGGVAPTKLSKTRSADMKGLPFSQRLKKLFQ
jgi:hypothetical protein